METLADGLPDWSSFDNKKFFVRTIRGKHMLVPFNKKMLTHVKRDGLKPVRIKRINILSS